MRTARHADSHLRLAYTQPAPVRALAPMPQALPTANQPTRTEFVEIQHISSLAWRHWDTLVNLAASPATPTLRTQMSNALAALVAEVTPASREILASTYATRGAVGAGRIWDLPPYITGGLRTQQQWAATVVLDCVNEQANRFASGHSLAERASWLAAARTLTQGFEVAPGAGRRMLSA